MEREGPKFPKGVTDKISKRFSWLKGTEWNWNHWRAVKFNKDGGFDAPTKECQLGHCKWSASKNKVFVLWGQVGIHELEIDGEIPSEQDPHLLEGMTMTGFRHRDHDECTATFVRVFDYEAAELETDLYEVLGLKDDANEAEIKKVYRKLSIRYHPDKNPDAESQKKFNEIRNAYEVLNDPDKKILYDTGGMEAVKSHEKGQVETGEDVHMELEVSLEDLYTGASQEAQIQRRVVCRACSKMPDLPHCKGCGRCPNEVKMVTQQMMGMLIQQQQEVPSNEKCKQETTKIEVQIERGMRDGEQVPFLRMGEQRPGMLPGAIIFILKTQKDSKFVRKGNDLHLDMVVTLREALLGWTQTIRHMDGHIVELDTSSITKPFQVIKVVGEGMPLRDDPATFGDLYVKVKVEFPKKLTSDQRMSVESIFPRTPPRTEL